MTKFCEVFLVLQCVAGLNCFVFLSVARPPCRAMTLRIQRVVDHCDLQLSHCLREGEEEDPSELTVLFLHEKSSQAGSSVQVFAPWWVGDMKNAAVMCPEKMCTM